MALGQPQQPQNTVLGGIQGALQARELGNQLGLQQDIQNLFAQSPQGGSQRDQQLAQIFNQRGFTDQAAKVEQRANQKMAQEAQLALEPIRQAASQFIKAQDQTGLDNLVSSAKSQLGQSQNRFVSQFINSIDSVSLTPQGAQIISSVVTDENHPFVQSGLVEPGKEFQVVQDENGRIQLFKEKEKAVEKGRFKTFSDIGVFDSATGEIDLLPELLAKKGKLDIKDQFKLEQNLRKELTALTKDFRVINDSFRKLEVASEVQTPASDIAMVFNFMKILDPPSVIREGEQATARNARAVPDAIRNLYNRVLKGHDLTPEQRADFLNQGRNQFIASKKARDTAANQFGQIADDFGLDRSRVVVNIGAEEVTGTQADDILNQQVIQIQTKIGRDLTPQEIEVLRQRGVQ